MNLHAGLPFWLVKNGLLAEYPTLNCDLEDEEIVIIGSGISGAICAYVLGNAGFRCTIVDKRLVSSGSTWASTAHLNYELDASLTNLIDWYGEAFAVQVYQASLAAVEKVRQIAEKTGVRAEVESKESLYLASGKQGSKAIEKEYRLRKLHHLPVDLLSREALQSTYGINRLSALHHSTAVQLDAYQMTAGLIQYAVQHFGLTVYTRTAVIKWQPEKDGVTVQTDLGYRIKAKKMVCAPGYEADLFLPKKVVSLHSTYALVTQPVSPDLLWKDGCLIWETARPYFYLRTTADNRIMIGGRDENFSKEQRRDRLLDHKTKQLLKDCRKLFPQLSVVADFSWCGTFGETDDSLPYIGAYPGLEHVFFSLGYGGNGITYSMTAAEIICNELSGGTDNRSQLFSFTRKRK